MLNVFYRDEHLQGRMNGPKKVIENLIRSLEDTNTPFAINQEKYENNLFLHWDSHHVQRYQSLRNKDKLLVGPQFWPFAPESSQLTEYGKVITPSEWVSDLFVKHFGIRTLNWPVAIYAPEVKDNIKTDCLIYYKNRPEDHLLKVTNFLEQRGISYTGLQYGNYTQEEFRESLSEVKYCVIIDNTESQGIAIQEMMAVNKPLFVWDQTVWDHMGEQYAVESTSVPYWDPICGERVRDASQLNLYLDIFLQAFDGYNPAKFVEKNLSAKPTVKILLDLFNEN